MAQFGQYGNLVMIVILWGAIFYFLVMRPNKKRQKEQKALFDSLQEGVEVITAGGIKGTILSVGEAFVDIKVDKGVKLTVRKTSISTIVK